MNISTDTTLASFTDSYQHRLPSSYKFFFPTKPLRTSWWKPKSMPHKKRAKSIVKLKDNSVEIIQKPGRNRPRLCNLTLGKKIRLLTTKNYKKWWFLSHNSSSEDTKLKNKQLITRQKLKRVYSKNTKRKMISFEDKAPLLIRSCEFLKNISQAY